MKYQCWMKLRWTSGMPRDVAGGAAVAVLLDEDVPGQPERQEVDRRPGDDLVDLQMDRPDGMDRRHRHPRERSRAETDQPRPAAGPRMRPDRAPDSEEGACQEHPLERDVDHAASLAEEAADRRVGQRRRVPEGRRQESAPHDNAVEVRGRRARGQKSEDDAEQTRGDRTACDATLPARPGPDASRNRQDADEDRQHRGAGGEGWQRQPERERAEGDTDDPDGARARPADAADPCGDRRHVCRLRRSHAATPPRLRPTKRMTRPWMIVVRFPARSGRKIDGSS